MCKRFNLLVIYGKMNLINKKGFCWCSLIAILIGWKVLINGNNKFLPIFLSKIENLSRFFKFYLSPHHLVTSSGPYVFFSGRPWPNNLPASAGPSPSSCPIPLLCFSVVTAGIIIYQNTPVSHWAYFSVSPTRMWAPCEEGFMSLLCLYFQHEEE